MSAGVVATVERLEGEVEQLREQLELVDHDRKLWRRIARGLAEVVRERAPGVGVNTAVCAAIASEG